MSYRPIIMVGAKAKFEHDRKAENNAKENLRPFTELCRMTYDGKTDTVEMNYGAGLTRYFNGDKYTFEMVSNLDPHRYRPSFYAEAGLRIIEREAKTKAPNAS